MKYKRNHVIAVSLVWITHKFFAWAKLTKDEFSYTEYNLPLEMRETHQHYTYILQNHNSFHYIFLYSKIKKKLQNTIKEFDFLPKMCCSESRSYIRYQSEEEQCVGPQSLKWFQLDEESWTSLLAYQHIQIEEIPWTNPRIR